MSSWVSFMLLLTLSISFNGVSGARHGKGHHSASVLTGTVYCDTCFRQEAPKSTQFISGATVAVECTGDDANHNFHKQVQTNEKGEFKAKLPSSITKNIHKIKSCSVKLLTSTHPNCAVSAAASTSSDIQFNSRNHVFSSGFFTFKPQLCNHKLSRQNPTDQKTFGFPFPPNPFQPPTLPPLPLVPSPPSLVPPLPFQPSPPSLLPPIFPSPPPAPVFPPLPPLPPLPFPPVPSLIPSPPPPPPPAFPIPLPPIPVIPGFPPVPPAGKSSP